MTKITMKVPYVQTVEIDTAEWTRDQWIKFITDHISPSVIEHIIKTDMFPLERLKEKAIAAHELCQEFKL